MFERGDENRGVDRAARVVAVGAHDQRVHAPSEGVDVAQLPCDLGVGCVGGVHQHSIDLRVGLPLRGMGAEAVQVEARELVPESVVHAAFAGDSDLAACRHDEEVPPEAADRLAGVLLDRDPERVLDLALLRVRQTHQHVVVDELVVAQRLPGGVEALEDLLGVGSHAERDRDVLELLQPAPDPRRLLGADLTAEEGVVVIEAGLPQLTVGRAPVQDDALEDLRPRAMRPQLGARAVG